MKVKELIAQLQKLDPELTVVALVGHEQSVVKALEVVRAPDYFELESPLFAQLKTLFKPSLTAAKKNLLNPV